MKNSTRIVLTVWIIVVVLIGGCSDIKNNLPAAPAPTAIEHVSGWIDTSSSNFHGHYIATMKYDIRPCQQCHGSDYKGGTSAQSCYQCHTESGGPENCATCHGMPPPPSLNGGMNSSASGVGAHLIHWNGNGAYSSYPMRCESCHQMPVSMYGSTHITTSGRANLVFADPLAALKSSNGSPIPAYSYDSLRCSNTFCHGAWRLVKSGLPSDSVFTDSVMTGNKYAPKWNGGASEKACGTCHNLPPIGHKTYTQSCSACHEDVSSAAGKAKHINGKRDLNGGIVRIF